MARKNKHSTRLKSAPQKRSRKAPNRDSIKPKLPQVKAVRSSEKLKAGAFKVFAQYGFHGATTKQIAAEAGVNETLISRHFGNKQGLFVAVVREHGIPIPKSLPYPPQQSIADELLLYVDYSFELSRANANFLRLVIAHALVDQEFVRNLREEVAVSPSVLFYERLRLLQEKKLLSVKADLQAIEAFVRNQVFATTFFGHTLLLVDEKLALSDLHAAVRIYSYGLATL